ncbi:MAG TPA: hypothetical protein VEC19_20135 [Usitatibacter sp.]|nr:hypothetical protein [Usitatibacter sp.]
MLEARGVIFDLYHTLTARESQWSQAFAHTCDLLGVERRAWDRALNASRWAHEVEDLLTLSARAPVA